ncbi:MAG: histidine phosphatase family protein [Opitutaceae bacterium]|nr:histidine phosphatase family protein [Opitutaceae bacterium]
MKPTSVSFRRWFVLMLTMLAALPGAWAQSTIFISRHADRGPEEPDALLTAKGECRANALSLLLSDSRIRHIYVTEFTRTQQTAAPTSRLFGVKPEVIPYKELDRLAARVRETAKPGESTLVVGHRESVPGLVKALTGQDVEPLGSGEYTRLFAVTIFADGRTSLVTLRQGVECDKDPAHLATD